MRPTAILILLAVSLSTTALADIVIMPSPPTNIDGITIRVQNIFGSDAHVTSDSIMQSGNTFVVHQNIQRTCSPIPPPPNAPFVTSEFHVGLLPPGNYNVQAIIAVTGVPAECTNPPFTQTATFTVVQAVPMIDWPGLVLLGSLLALTAAIATITGKQ
jgi:hypothetical protein